MHSTHRSLLAVDTYTVEVLYERGDLFVLHKQVVSPRHILHYVSLYLLVLQDCHAIVYEYGGWRRLKVGPGSIVKLLTAGGIYLKSGGGFCISTVVTLRLIVFNSASRYKSMKYSWQNKHAPFRQMSSTTSCSLPSHQHTQFINMGPPPGVAHFAIPKHDKRHIWEIAKHVAHGEMIQKGGRNREWTTVVRSLEKGVRTGGSTVKSGAGSAIPGEQEVLLETGPAPSKAPPAVHCLRGGRLVRHWVRGHRHLVTPAYHAPRHPCAEKYIRPSQGVEARGPLNYSRLVYRLVHQGLYKNQVRLQVSCNIGFSIWFRPIYTCLGYRRRIWVEGNTGIVSLNCTSSQICTKPHSTVLQPDAASQLLCTLLFFVTQSDTRLSPTGRDVRSLQRTLSILNRSISELRSAAPTDRLMTSERRSVTLRNTLVVVLSDEPPRSCTAHQVAPAVCGPRSQPRPSQCCHALIWCSEAGSHRLFAYEMSPGLDTCLPPLGPPFDPRPQERNFRPGIVVRLALRCCGGRYLQLPMPTLADLYLHYDIKGSRLELQVLRNTTGREALVRSETRKYFQARVANCMANLVQSPAESPDLRKWESCRTMPLVGGFSPVSPVSPTLSFRRRSILTSITIIGSQNLAVKSQRRLHPSTFSGFRSPISATCLPADSRGQTPGATRRVRCALLYAADS
ncbi:hypothetical protein PR048_032937 [Dryococelus australis]|uniref:Uncharacterized protein n=1 Tax=Dryococelus australis TaxID=614101 RepID=A0ABQ9G3P3_9NEOP|nr:hypothetical protein PR048_032937 [Dryococelus australis]